MSKPVPVSTYPDEVVCRPCRVLKTLSALFEDGEPTRQGLRVNVRRSPFENAPRSYWIEDEQGTLLNVVTETILYDCLEEVKS